MSNRNRFLLIIILTGYCLYAAAFIYRTSFVIDGERYFTLLDDAMISMRYAKNLAAGHGLIWNPGGERVEGYTNPLWVLYMAAVHFLPVPESKVSLIVQITGLLCLLINLLYVKRVADAITDGQLLASMTAVFLTAFSYPLLYFSLRGMEVCLSAVITSYSVWRAYLAVHQGRSVYPGFIALGMGTFVRLDMIVVFVAVLAYFLVTSHEKRTRNVVTGLGILLLCILAQTLLRVAYYGEYLPNTYYLKMTGLPLLWRMSRGVLGSVKFITAFYQVAIVLPFVYLLLRKNRFSWLLVWVLIGQILYSIYVGGDAFDNVTHTNRFLVIALPLLFVLCGCALVELKTVLSIVTSDNLLRFRQLFKFSGVALVCSWLVSFNLGYGSASAAEWLLIDRPKLVQEDRDKVETARILKRVTSADASLAVVWAGAIPYFSDRPAIDLLGKNDKVIARKQMQFLPSEGPKLLYEYRAFWPGHSKWDYAYSIGHLRPDVVVQQWHRVEDAKPFLDEYYVKRGTPTGEMHFLKGSNKVAWDQLDALAQR